MHTTFPATAEIPSTTLTRHRYNLHAQDMLRLSPGSHTIQVVTGHAWITIAEHDVVVSAGEATALIIPASGGLLSSLGSGSLTLDLIQILTAPTAGWLKGLGRWFGFSHAQ